MSTGQPVVRMSSAMTESNVKTGVLISFGWKHDGLNLGILVMF